MFTEMSLTIRVAIISLAIFAVSPGAAFGAWSGGSAIVGGMLNAQMEQLCLEAMQNYMAGKGPPPPAVCDQAAASAPIVQEPQRRITCLPINRGAAGTAWTCY